MIKLRYGNDFVFVWSIKRHDVPVDLNTATEKTLKLIYRGGVKLIPFTVSDTNKIRIEFTPLILDMTGGYSLEFSFILPDINLQDAGQLCTLDLELFLLVEKTSNADETEQMQFSSDIGFGLIGDSSFTSWLKIPENVGKNWNDYIAYLREPMTLAIAEGEQTAAEWAIKEAERVANELIRKENEEGRIEESNELIIDVSETIVRANQLLDNIDAIVDGKEDKSSTVYLLENEYQVLLDNDLVLPDVQYNIFE